jgi:hypothetical protein
LITEGGGVLVETPPPVGKAFVVGTDDMQRQPVVL